MDKRLKDVRKPAVAGQFYPGDPGTLVKTIAGFFAEVDKEPLSGRPVGIIAPHAGYPYSGKTAAKAYKLLEGEEFDTIVVVSPSHTVFFKGCSVFTGGGYQTPLGVMETDQELAQKAASIHPLVYASAQGHATGSARGEHALEVHLPFLQVVLPLAKLVAIVMGDQEEESVGALGEVLASVLKSRNALMVASTDLSHFHSEKKANRLDAAVKDAIEAYDPTELTECLETGKGEACGGGPVAAVMSAARRLGSRELKFLDYTTSGAATGDFSEVVGYLSAVMVMGQKAENALAEKKRVAGVMGAMAARRTDRKLTDEGKAQLHKIARKAIAAQLEGKDYKPARTGELDMTRGAFVTIKIDGELRGCIGQIRAHDEIYRVIADMAVAAAFDDPRFPRLTKEEFERLEFEISVLTPLRRVHEFREIKVGRDGLMIKLDMHSGLLLPQVATEYGWNTTEFLEQTCLKAGLPRESYKDKFAEIYRFAAEVF